MADIDIHTKMAKVQGQRTTLFRDQQGDKVVGLVTLDHIKEVPCSEWPTTTGAQVMVSAPQTRGGRHFLSRLAALGFTPGARLRVMQNFGHSPIIVNLRDTRVALGRGEATKILVERLVGGEDGCRS
jgi:ferrous iron transport protein A